jgi:hypothetical protein
MPELQDFNLQPEKKRESLDLDTMSREQLLALHSKIEQKIGGLSLTEVNLVKETLLQIHRAKALQETASTAADAPLNQRAQVQNSLGTMIKDLAKMQSGLFNSERIKRIQIAVVKVVKTLPKAQQDHFFELLEEELARAAEETDHTEVVAEL